MGLWARQGTMYRNLFPVLLLALGCRQLGRVGGFDTFYLLRQTAPSLSPGRPSRQVTSSVLVVRATPQMRQRAYGARGRHSDRRTTNHRYCC